MATKTIMKSISFKILLGRFLTRSGDQAWEFAVPLTLLHIFPGQIRIAATYYLVVKLLNVLITPKLSRIVDQKSRIKVAYAGVSLQLVGVLFGAGCLVLLNLLNLVESNMSIGRMIFLFAVLGVTGLLSSLGSTLMDISIASDLVPSVIDKQNLAVFNSRMSQVDLFTEVVSPLLAGLLLTITHPTIALVGFLLVALWNLISFFPELMLLRSIFKMRPDLLKLETSIAVTVQESMWQQLKTGWASFFKQPVAIPVVAYALLWLSVLSPHGVLLTSYLKDAWNMPELIIGSFRGLGALFGLVSTIIFPVVIGKFGLLKGSRYLILFQSVMLLIGLGFFLVPSAVGQYGFLIFILFSRIGLYGFSLGEMQIRQLGIPSHQRGEVNGFAHALTGIATLMLFVFGALIPSTSQFSILIFGSVGFVVLGAVLFLAWKPKIQI